ncbi:MAG: hypothetical protein II543_02600, partial [Desulfovibrio sp.]|nr:hypothetical protein [Desulfovibrio sp.]
PSSTGSSISTRFCLIRFPTMCRDVGLTILKLRRIAEGPLVLGRLGSGEVRELTADEVARLKQDA